MTRLSRCDGRCARYCYLDTLNDDGWCPECVAEHARLHIPLQPAIDLVMPPTTPPVHDERAA